MTGTAAISSDFTTFLKLLTTQMTHQDPLKPVDSTDFATQLATFSTVEQQTLTNELLGTLSGQMGLLGMSQLAAWVGQEARTDADVWMDGDPVTLDYATATGADRAVLVITDAAGNTVSREELPLGAHQAEWMGADATGTLLPTGYYRLTVESYRGDQKLASSAVQSYARILEARNSAGGTTLVLEGGAEVSSDRISALRIPPG